MPRVPADPAEPADDRVIELLEQLLLRAPLEGSSAVDAICRDHPEHADELRAGYHFLQRRELVRADAGGVPQRLGEYRLLRRLGGGGMGVVYLAEQASLGRQVAIKLIRPELLWLAGSRTRFRREAEAIAKLQHPAIVPVHTAGEIDGIPFFVMDHVVGASLAGVLAALQGRTPDHLGVDDLAAALQAAAQLPAAPGLPFTGPWWHIAGTIARQVADAVAHAHERGVLHRDLKPSNVMLGRDGRVQLVDFGLARGQGDAELTRPGTPLGSLAYMAPEQVVGRADIDGRADVYGLGVTLYELLTLHSPFLAGDSESTRARVLAANAAGPRTRYRALPRDLEIVCLHAMAPEPEQRYPTMAAFARDLANALSHAPIAARRAGPWLRLVRFRRRHPATATLLAVLLLGLPMTGWLVANHFAERTVVQLGIDTAQGARIAGVLQQGWTSYRTAPRRALACFAEVLQLAPEHPLAVLGSCLATSQQGDRAKVEAVLAQHPTVVARFPMFALVPRMLQFDGSAPFPLPDDAAIPATPIDWFLVGLAARQRAELGDAAARRRALACFDQCIQLSPTPEFVFFASRCEALVALGDHERGRQAVQVLTTRWPDSACALAVAASAIKHADPQLAEELLERALQIDPDELFAWLQLGRLRFMQGDKPGYLAAIERVFELRPDDAEVLTELARARLVTHDVDGALAAITEALRTGDPLPEIHLVHGSVLAEAARPEAAFAAWARAEQLAPRSSEPCYYRAQVRIQQERYDEAIAELRQAIAREPDNAVLHASLAIACRRAHDPKAALAAALRASELAPDHAPWRLELAFAQWRAGELGPAKANLQQVVAAMPDHEEAHAVRLQFAIDTGDAALQAEERARWQQRQRR